MTQRILVVSAHIGEEILGCGGALALHVSRGDSVRVLVLGCVGVTGADELATVIGAVRGRSADSLDFTSLAVDDLDIIAAARWRVPPVAWGNASANRSR
jgi:hypothetical protein